MFGFLKKKPNAKQAFNKRQEEPRYVYPRQFDTGAAQATYTGAEVPVDAVQGQPYPQRFAAMQAIPLFVPDIQTPVPTQGFAYIPPFYYGATPNEIRDIDNGQNY